jgi:diguanylate cyclase (GGDEF)-like protein/PAS domain S-box-containing protein
MSELRDPNLSPPASGGDERFALLVDAVRGYAIVLLDPAGRIVHWNSGAREMFGYAESEIVGHTLHDLYLKPDVQLGLPEASFAILKEEGHCEEEGWRVRKDGARFWASVVLTALRNPDGSLRAFSAIIRDVTLRKRAEWLERDCRQVLELVARNEPLARVLQRLGETLERQCVGMKTSILLLRDGWLAGVEGPKLSHQFLEPPDPRTIRLAAGLQSLSAQRSQGIVVTDMRSQPLWKEFRQITIAQGLRVCWSLAVTTSDGEAMAMILLFGETLGTPTAAEHEAIESIGRLLAIALEHRQLGEQLAYQAHHDQLTGLPNRMLFADRLQLGLAQARRSGLLIALLMMDLDRFKYINDTLGHHVGDQLLQEVAARWRVSMRESDTLARLGGDEFALILPSISDRRDAVRVAGRLVEALREPLQIAGHELFVTASIGIAIFPQDGDDVVALQRNADVAMYRTKNASGNGYQCFEQGMNARAVERLEIEAFLRRSVDGCVSNANGSGGDFELHFHPQVDATAKLIGFEALLRWHHPKLGTVSPNVFIPIAEETGLIRELGVWVLREACRQNRRWQLAGHRPVKMAVNVSALQFAQAGFAGAVSAALADAALDPRWLDLEITESLLMKNTRDAIAKLSVLRNLGVGVAIDDFGTGYSSLAYLHPFHSIR